MKKFFLIITVVCLFIIGLQAQNTQSRFYQQELFKKFLGTWQATVGKDSLEILIYSQYGKAFIVTQESVINGQKSPIAIINIGFSSKENVFKGYALNPSGASSTWIGSFTTEKMFCLDMVQNLDPTKVTSKRQCVLEGIDNWTYTILNKEGIKIRTVKFSRVK